MIDTIAASFPAFALQPPGQQPGAAAPADGASFSAVLSGLASDGVATLGNAEIAALAGISGRMQTFAVIEQVMAAERTLQATIAIRDKAVGAYLELSRMQI